MKKLLAVILTVALLVGMCSIAANAALPPESYNNAKYFEDTENWGQVLLYAWDSEGNALCGEWPGVQLEAINPHQGCVTAYVINLPEGAAGFVLNDGYYRQTVDVTDLGYDTYYLSGETDELGHYYVSHNDYILETTEPYTGTDPYPRKSTIDLTDNFGWYTAYMYAWDENGSALCGEWPGTKVTNTSTNDYGERIFTITVPENAAGIIVNNGAGAQTEDITDFCHYDGYWMDGTKNELGHYKVTGYPEYIADPTGAEPTEGTTAQPQPCLYGFYNSQDFDSVYFYAWDNEGNPTFGEWPGTAMYVDRVDEATGWQVYRFYVPEGTAGIIINDGQGRQTEDITTLNLDAYWLPGTKDSQGHYVVEEYKGQEMTTAEPETQPTTKSDHDCQSEIMLTNNFSWEKGYLYAWDKDGNSLCSEWPGTEITEKSVNDFGEERYLCHVPVNAVGIIVNNGIGAQTEDITDFNIAEYWMDGTKDDLGHYYVTPVTYDPDETTDPTETRPTTAPAPDSSYYFYNTLDFENVYVYAFDAQDNALCGEWPGTRAEKVGTDPKTGDDKYLLNIPAGTKGIVISDGNGHQTRDITDFTVNSYWLDGSKNDLGYYLVSPNPGYIEPTVKLGDVNGDDLISVSDATLVQQQAAELIDLEGSALAAADTNRDGIVTVADATLIQQYAAEMIESF